VSNLGQRAVQTGRWRWLPGMAYWWQGDRDRVQEVEPGTLRTDGSLLPDLTDPATIGAALGLVREAWRDQRAYLMPAGSAWTVVVGDAALCGSWSEGEALVVALERAP